jgi:hypothetical protein
MTEQFEVIELQEDLQDAIEELKYEAATRPGEGSEVEALFIASVESIQKAVNLLNKALKIMKDE